MWRKQEILAKNAQNQPFERVKTHEKFKTHKNWDIEKFLLLFQETFFRQSTYIQPSNPDNFRRCPSNKICTQSVLRRSKMSLYDVGGPLYKLSCNEVLAECLYGVASYSKTEFVLSKEGEVEQFSHSNVFENVPNMVGWIFSIIYEDL